MHKQHFTFTADGRAMFVAITSNKDAASRLIAGERRAYLERLTELGRPLLDPGAVISMRPSLPDEVAAFDRLGAATIAAGQIGENELRGGWPIFLIDATDPELPSNDINTGLPRAALPIVTVRLSVTQRANIVNAARRNAARLGYSAADWSIERMRHPRTFAADLLMAFDPGGDKRAWFDAEDTGEDHAASGEGFEIKELGA